GVTAILAAFSIPSFVATSFGVALTASVGVLLFLGNVIVALAIGGMLLRQQGAQPVGRALLALAIGLFALYAMKSLPVVGYVFSIAAWFAGGGAIILNMIHSQRLIPPPPPPPQQPVAGGGDGKSQ